MPAAKTLLSCAILILMACSSTTDPSNAGKPQVLWTHRDEAGARSQPFADTELAVYTTAFDRRVVALDARTGSPRWQRRLPDVLPGRDLPIGNISVHDDLIVVPGWDLFALDRASGAIAWQFAPEDEYPAGSAVAIEDGRIYTSGAYKRFYTVDARTGALLWRTDLGERPFAPVVDDGVVYVGTRGYIGDSNALGAGHAVALNASDGRVLWRVPLPDAPDMAWQGGAVNAGALTPELFIVASVNGRVYGIERTSGRVRWEHRGSAPYQSGAAVLDRVAVVADLAGNIEGLDGATGELLWSNTTGGSSVTSQITTDGECAYISVGGVLCVDGKGVLRWRIGGWSNGGPSYSTPTFSTEGRLFAGSLSGFHALALTQ